MIRFFYAHTQTHTNLKVQPHIYVHVHRNLPEAIGGQQFAATFTVCLNGLKKISYLYNGVGRRNLRRTQRGRELRGLTPQFNIQFKIISFSMYLANRHVKKK